MATIRLLSPGMKQVATATITKIGPAEPWPRLWILGSQVASFLGANDVTFMHLEKFANHHNIP